MVIEVGPEVQGFAVGDLVACAGGGYASHAEVVAVPRNLCVKIPVQSENEGAIGGTREAGIIKEETKIQNAEVRMKKTKTRGTGEAEIIKEELKTQSAERETQKAGDRTQVALKRAAYNTLGAIALQGIRQADLKLGESCVVIGLGLIGQLTCLMLRAGGIKVIGVDIDPAMVAIAREHYTALKKARTSCVIKRSQ